MNTDNAQSWMEAGFLAVEGAMATEIATAKQISMSEDFIRGAMLRGLLMSKHNHKGTVLREYTPEWARAHCWNNPVHKQGKGRKPQHDVAIVAVPKLPNAKELPLAICEVKWIKSASVRMAELVAKDIWKVAFTVGTAPPGSACKGYLLIGGVDNHLSATLKLLRNAVKLSWSEAGRPTRRIHVPSVRIGGFLDHTVGATAFSSLLKWGAIPHYRQPPSIWWHLRADCLHTWLRTTRDGVRWRIALWELHHRAVADKFELDWARIAPTFGFTC